MFGVAVRVASGKLLAFSPQFKECSGFRFTESVNNICFSFQLQQKIISTHRPVSRKLTFLISGWTSGYVISALLSCVIWILYEYYFILKLQGLNCHKCCKIGDNITCTCLMLTCHIYLNPSVPPFSSSKNIFRMEVNGSICKHKNTVLVVQSYDVNALILVWKTVLCKVLSNVVAMMINSFT